jgi:hypothetical protein
MTTDADVSKVRAYALLLLLLEERTDEAELYDSLLDEADSRALSRTVLALAAVVLAAAWGDQAAPRIRALIDAYRDGGSP